MLQSPIVVSTIANDIEIRALFRSRYWEVDDGIDVLLGIYSVEKEDDGNLKVQTLDGKLTQNKLIAVSAMKAGLAPAFYFLMQTKRVVPNSPVGVLCHHPIPRVSLKDINARNRQFPVVHSRRGSHGTRLVACRPPVLCHHRWYSMGQGLFRDWSIHFLPVRPRGYQP